MLGTPISRGTRPNKPKAAFQAVELQELLMADARSGEVTPAVRAQLARAWVDLQEMRLRLAMKPAPKPIDVSGLRKTRQKTSLAPEAPATPPVQKPPA